MKKIRTTNGNGKIFNSVLDTIGNTPVIKINNIPTDNCKIYVKAEYFNPASSVKDRLAVNIIEEAERNGSLTKGQTVIEATSGNTGIGLAMVCASKGYPLVITMAESFSIERRKLMRMLGARVVLTPKEEKGIGMYKKAVELADANNWFFASQFETEANARIHASTTAREILNDFKNINLDYFVTGYGTGGTVTGVSKELKKYSPHTKIILTEPSNANLVASKIKQLRNKKGQPDISHKAWNPHLIQGWTPDFIPLILQEAIDKKLFNEIIPITGEEGIKYSKLLAQKEGIFTGISGGSTFAVAKKISKEINTSSSILVMLPDTGERYLSTLLFDGINAEMNEEETKLMLSTPGYQIKKN